MGRDFLGKTVVIPGFVGAWFVLRRNDDGTFVIVREDMNDQTMRQLVIDYAALDAIYEPESD